MSRKQKMAGTAGTVALLVVVLAIGVVSSSGTGQEPCVRVATTTSFDDVAAGDAAVVAAVVGKGMMQGCGSTYFCPGEFVPREDMAVALARAMRGSTCSPAQPTAPPTDDPPTDDVTAGRPAGTLCARPPVLA